MTGMVLRYGESWMSARDIKGKTFSSRLPSIRFPSFWRSNVCTRCFFSWRKLTDSLSSISAFVVEVTMLRINSSTLRRTLYLAPFQRNFSRNSAGAIPFTARVELPTKFLSLTSSSNWRSTFRTTCSTFISTLFRRSPAVMSFSRVPTRSGGTSSLVTRPSAPTALLTLSTTRLLAASSPGCDPSSFFRLISQLSGDSAIASSSRLSCYHLLATAHATTPVRRPLV
mmetsp:Transcript_9586/g.16834  ORF Transcript_9586/g.16834 Transcript_9586/m.16834 type:complete len:226 (-) Transcript_9586:188-865(-)